MKHVIYRTEYYSRAGILLRDEECNAYFNTLENNKTIEFEVLPPIGCKLLQPKLIPSRIFKEQWEILKSKKPDYDLKYATLCDDKQEYYSIYAIYEKIIDKEESKSIYSLGVSIGTEEDVVLEMFVNPIDYNLSNEHITRWDEVEIKGIEMLKTDNYVKIQSCPNSPIDKRVVVHHENWTITGRWKSMEQISQHVFVYHCKNTLFPFSITINLEQF